MAEEDGFITEIRLNGFDCQGKTQRETEVIKAAFSQLDEYFNGRRRKFDIPLMLTGTEFQKKVYSELLKIPYGETRSYSDVAESIGNRKAVRAVGSANNKNPVIIVIPCHRVIGKDGSLVGYGGGIEVKNRLLELERKHSL